MTTEQLQAEAKYRASMAIAKSMLKQGMLTKQEYEKMNGIMIKKYNPILGSLTQ